MRSLLAKIRPEHVLLVALLQMALISHAYNMFNYPYYENDEGTYMSQAWSVLTLGELAPYTYWYDHAPLGWIFLSLWTLVTGGFFTFGFSVNSGRVFMLVLHLISVYFVFDITKKLSKSILASSIAVLVFSLSPMGTFYQRRVLLDNIMVFWTFFSLWFLMREKVTTKNVVISAVFLGIGILSKESALFFVPGFLLVLFLRLHKYHRIFNMVQWIAILGSVVSAYVLYALLNNELFPSGTWLGGSTPHVSLIESLRFQSSRSNGYSVFDVQHAEIWEHVRAWIAGDALMIYGSLLGFFICALIGIKRKILWSLCLLYGFYVFFLFRGGVVIGFYILPLIPIMAIMIGVSAHEVFLLGKSIISRIHALSDHRVIRRAGYITTTLVMWVAFVVYYINVNTSGEGIRLYKENQTSAQIDAIEWIRDNIRTDSIFIVDNYGLVDLKAQDNPSNKAFKNAEWYWKVDRDVEIKDGLLQGNPAKIDVVAMTPQTRSDIKEGDLQFLGEAVRNSSTIKEYWSDGWGVEFYATKYPRQILDRSWESYKRKFVTDDGYVIDLKNKGVVTSEIQAYTLLRAVWMDDHTTFDHVWSWTKLHMQRPDGLHVWKVDYSGKRNESGTLTEADTDIALALALASKKFNNDQYKSDAKKVIEGIRTNEVKYVGETPYIIGNDWIKREGNAIVKPGALAPYAYRIFTEIDKGFDWHKVVDSSYLALNSCSRARLNSNSSVYLAPEWCELDSRGQAYQPREPLASSKDYVYSAVHVPWRIALDYKWYGDPQARAYLADSSFVRDEWLRNEKIMLSYSHSGNPTSQYESVVSYATALGNFIVTDPNTARILYNNKIAEVYFQPNEAESYWEDSDNVYTQNWAWLGTALYSEHLDNVWETSVLAHR